MPQRIRHISVLEELEGTEALGLELLLEVLVQSLLLEEVAEVVGSVPQTLQKMELWGVLVLHNGRIFSSQVQLVLQLWWTEDPELARRRSIRKELQGVVVVPLTERLQELVGVADSTVVVVVAELHH